MQAFTAENNEAKILGHLISDWGLATLSSISPLFNYDFLTVWIFYKAHNVSFFLGHAVLCKIKMFVS